VDALISATRFLVCHARAAEGEALAAALGLSFQFYDEPLKAVLKAHEPAGVALVLEPEGLGFYALDMPGSGAVRVDLAEGSLGWRIAQERARHEMIVKACGLKKAGQTLQVFDATAGLLRDACVLAAAGATVHVAERSPLVAALIKDGLQRAELIPDLHFLLGHLTFHAGDALQQLQQLQKLAGYDTDHDTDHDADHGVSNGINHEARLAWRPDVVCLDPMFPHRDKTALVKKEMRVFRAVVGEDNDADKLLAPALAAAKKRVVVKRSRLAPWLANKKPSMVMEGKSGRFDIYLVG
jgi:16S rRNA (guanine1516-N2)-methyltransferase